MTPNDDRARILAAIAAALGRTLDAAPAELETDGGFPDDIPSERDVPVLARRFRQELALVGGETRLVARRDQLADAVGAFAAERGLGAASTDVRTADYAVLHAEALIAETGSVVVIERSGDRGLAPYLPRTCIVIGYASSLHARLTPQAMASIFGAARRGDRGEAVIITGPSRTADIEKVLVLGAHGPKDLVVFIVGIEPESLGSR